MAPSISTYCEINLWHRCQRIGECLSFHRLNWFVSRPTVSENLKRPCPRASTRAWFVQRRSDVVDNALDGSFSDVLPFCCKRFVWFASMLVWYATFLSDA